MSDPMNGQLVPEAVLDLLGQKVELTDVIWSQASSPTRWRVAVSAVARVALKAEGSQPRLVPAGVIVECDLEAQTVEVLAMESGFVRPGIEIAPEVQASPRFAEFLQKSGAGPHGDLGRGPVYEMVGLPAPHWLRVDAGIIDDDGLPPAAAPDSIWPEGSRVALPSTVVEQADAAAPETEPAAEPLSARSAADVEALLRPAVADFGDIWCIRVLLTVEALPFAENQALLAVLEKGGIEFFDDRDSTIRGRLWAESLAEAAKRLDVACEVSAGEVTVQLLCTHEPDENTRHEVLPGVKVADMRESYPVLRLANHGKRWGS